MQQWDMFGFGYKCVTFTLLLAGDITHTKDQLSKRQGRSPYPDFQTQEIKKIKN